MSNTSYLSVCRYFVDKGTDCGDLLKLMKLLYLSHGFFLAIKGESFLGRGQQFEAWTYGPVLRDLYYECRGEYRSTREFVTSLSDAPEVKDEIDRKILDAMLNRYGELSSFTLVELTHQQGSPWDMNYVRGEKRDIPDSDIKAYYKGLLESF